MTDLFKQDIEECQKYLKWLEGIGLSLIPDHPNAPNVYLFMRGRIAQYGEFVIGQPSQVTFMGFEWETDYVLNINRQRRDPHKVAQEILSTYPHQGKDGIAQRVVDSSDDIEGIASRMPSIIIP